MFSMTTQIIYSQWEQIGGDIQGEPFQIVFNNVSMNDSGDVIAFGSVNANFINVFQYVGNQWELKGNNITFAGSAGASVSLSGDGNTVVLGQFTLGSSNGSGGFEVFGYNGTAWEQKGSTIFGETHEQLGNVVEINNLGDKVIISGTAAGCPLQGNCGIVRVFEFDGNDWIPYGQKIHGVTSGEELGKDVAINDEGTIIAFSSINYRIPNTNDNVGLVRIYSYNGTEWQQLGEDFVSDTIGQPIGSSVSLNADGSKIAIGGASYNVNSINDGSVEVYQFSSNVWNLLGSRIVGENENDTLGYSVSLNNEGDIVTIGAPIKSNNVAGPGYVINYKFVDNNWILAGDVILGESNEKYFGSSVAINAAGDRIVGTSYLPDPSDGMARVYGNDSVLNIFEQEDLNNFKIYPNPSNNLTQIELGELFEAFSITVSDVSGKILIEKNYFNVSEINLNTNLKPGVYFIKLSNGTNVSTQKLIIK